MFKSKIDLDLLGHHHIFLKKTQYIVGRYSSDVLKLISLDIARDMSSNTHTHTSRASSFFFIFFLYLVSLYIIYIIYIYILYIIYICIYIYIILHLIFSCPTVASHKHWCRKKESPIPALLPQEREPNSRTVAIHFPAIHCMYGVRKKRCEK